MNTDDIRSVASLIDAIRRGHTPRYFFFWGHMPSPSGATTKACCSQWWRARFVVDGVSYSTAEHFMMAGKARLFNDDATLAAILDAPDPAAAKQLGREVRGFDEKVWNDARFGIVVRGNRAKFEQHEEMRRFLLGTGDQVLVEASPRDRIWGIGMAESNPSARHPEQWRGSNLLGFALMEVRSQLRDGGL